MDNKAIDTLRILAIDQIERANSGHPGLPMGAATMAYALWKNFLKGSAIDPTWIDRDRFILSAGHGSALLYGLLHMFGYDVKINDLKNFRQMGSITPGHPEYLVTPGIETTTGPLGQGISNAVGMAIAERRLAEEFNTPKYNIIDHYTYVIAGDGDLMEGVASESVSLAGHLKLGKLIVLYDSNDITIDGNTGITFTEDVGKRFEAYGWEVFNVSDGNDYNEICKKIKLAKIDTCKPTLIIIKTIIGYGSPNKSGKSSAHGSPLGLQESILTKEAFNWEYDESFFISDDVKDYMAEIIDKREIDRFLWEEMLEDYLRENPDMGENLKKWMDFGTVNISIKDYEDKFGVPKAEATRSISGKIMNLIAEKVPNFMGGSADLNSSTKTYLKNGKGYFQFDNQNGNNIAFGVREHGMASILNGLTLHGGIRPFGSTFLIFSDYMKPAIRLSALMELPVTYIFTHDSIGVGEDGPTHQPIEQLMMLRSIPNINIYRPADYRELIVSWRDVLNRFAGPSAIILSRQNLPTLEGSINEDIEKGGYIVSKECDGKKMDAIIIATGSEVSLAIDAKKILEDQDYNIRVISMPCWEKYEKNEDEYKELLLPMDFKNIISIEAGISSGWQKYVGREGLTISIDTFGRSGPGNEIMNYYGFEKNKVAEKIKNYLSK